MSNRNDRFRNIAPRPPGPPGQPGPPGPQEDGVLRTDNTQSAPQLPATPQTPVHIAPRAASENATSSYQASQHGTTPKGASGSHTLVACTACRRRKTKCDGRRPICTSCINKSTICDYVAEEKESHISALKRKNTALMDESDQLRYLVNYIIKCPEEDAIDIVRHLRRVQDVGKTIDLLKDSSLLLPLSQSSSSQTSSPAETTSSRHLYRLEHAASSSSRPDTSMTSPTASSRSSTQREDQTMADGETFRPIR